ncbi:hypothetical protein GCM10025877_13510 [Agromyces mangrovi Wang et al. 2018]|nr:hypothetical protein GCM10025877_13510 [Agromyces mangrovi]
MRAEDEPGPEASVRFTGADEPERREERVGKSFVAGASAVGDAIVHAGPARPARGPGLALFGSELRTMFRRWRTWAMLGALALIPILIAVAVRLTSGEGGGRRSSTRSRRTACSWA